MKRMARFSASIILVLSFALSAFADDGHMDCAGITSPPPEITVTAEVTEYAAVILQSALFLF